MKASVSGSPALQALLASGQFWMADLYTITLISGTVLRLATSDYDVTVVSSGQLYTSAGPYLQRSNIKQSLGASVDDMTITAYANLAHLVDGVPFLQAIRQGAFDGANLVIDRAFMPNMGDTSVGVVRRFGGRFGQIDADRTSAQITIKSHSELLSIQMPRLLYSPGCILTLYSPPCGVVRANYTFTGTVGVGSTLSAVNVLGLTTQGDHYFDTGIIAFNGGLIRRSIKTWTGDTAQLSMPLYTLPSPGDSVTMTAGCDKTLATCGSRFSNTAFFQGQPYIPDPETAA
jgi:uncharacterized phage protein (TIGR02218 family)